MGNYMPGAVNLPSPNFDARRDGVPLVVVLHIEGGSQEATNAWFQVDAVEYAREHPGDANLPLSAHLGVGHDGAVYQYVSVADSARSNGVTTGAVPADHGHAAKFLRSLPLAASPNRYSVSIEHEGVPGDDLEGAQFDASVRVGAWLFGPDGPLHGQPCDRDHVLRHSEIGSHPQCPGYSEETFTRWIAAVNAALKGDDVQVRPLDQSQTIEKVQRFVVQVTDIVADRNGDAGYEIVSGFPNMKPDHDYIVLEMKKGA